MKFLRKIKLPVVHWESFGSKLPRIGLKILYWIAGGLIIINLIILATSVSPEKQIVNPFHPTATPTLPFTYTPAPTLTPTIPVPTSTPRPITMMTGASSLTQGTIIFAMVNNGFSNLYSFQPGLPGFIRLTAHLWDDIDPALSPDGLKIAYSSKQNGYWNIYILDLVSGKAFPVTDTPAYDAHPAWSPDGSKLLIETYINDHSQLQIIDISSGTPVTEQITFGDWSSYDGVWSPDGKSIVYISTQSKQTTLWMVSLGDAQRVFNSLPVEETENPVHPVFSPDGTELAWSAMQDGFRSVFVWNLTHPDQTPRVIGRGDNITWSPDNLVILSTLDQPLDTYLTAYSVLDNNLVMPPFHLQGEVSGISWHATDSSWLQNPWVQQIQSYQDTPLYNIQITPVVESGRYNIVQVPNLSLQYPYLQDSVDESFEALRKRLASDSGWDFLASLQTAFLPISQAPAPDQIQDWLYTGRGISINTVPMNVGWMFITKEIFGSEVYWRVYIRPIYQDGSMGAPVHSYAWDMNSRFNNDPSAYENGGSTTQTEPTGYWIDFTEIAHRYGWNRLNALSNWIDFYPASRFYLFVNNAGLSWKDAMLQVYPQEIFETPTIVEVPSITPSNTPKPRKAITPSRTPFPTYTPTLRPTWTPIK